MKIDILNLESRTLLENILKKKKEKQKTKTNTNGNGVYLIYYTTDIYHILSRGELKGYLIEKYGFKIGVYISYDSDNERDFDNTEHGFDVSCDYKKTMINEFLLIPILLENTKVVGSNIVHI